MFDRAEKKIGRFALESFKLLVLNQFFKVLKLRLIRVFDVIEDGTWILEEICLRVSFVAFDADRHGKEMQFVTAWTGCNDAEKQG